MKTEIAIGAPEYPVLNAFMGSHSRVTCIMGPLGSGKTFGCCQKILKLMCEQTPNAQNIRPTRWVSVRNTYPDLMGTTVKDYEAVFEGLGKMKMGGMEPPTFHVNFMLEDGTRVKSEMVFLALDRDDAVKKLRGYQVTGFWLNEIKELQKAIVDMADLRHGRYPSMASGSVLPTWHGMIGDTNAPDEDHWYFKLAEEVKPNGWIFYRQPGGLLPGKKTGEWVSNPVAENLKNLPKGYYTNGAEGKEQDWIKINLGNEYGFVVEGRPVHPEYVDSTHTATDFIDADKRYPLVLGLDFGRTPAAAIMQYIESLGRWNIIDEFCSDDMSAAVFGPELKRYIDRFYPGMNVIAWGDPAGESQGQATEDTPIRIVRASGIPVYAAPSNVPALRRAALANPATRICMDGLPGLQVSPRARMIRKGLMGGFCYRRLKIAGESRYTDNPDKNQYSHPVEAAEYGALGGGEGHEALIPKGINRRGRGNRQTEAINW